jgi:hemolysin D
MENPDTNHSILTQFSSDAKIIELKRPPFTAHVTVYVLLAFIATLIGWASYSHIDKLVIARGKLVTPLSHFVVQPLESGILESIDVRIGQIVRKGDVLARLDTTFSRADLGLLSSRRNTLSLQLRRLEIELSNKSKVLLSDVDSIDNSQSNLQASLLLTRRAAFDSKVLEFDRSIKRQMASIETNEQDQHALSKRLKTLAEIEEMYQKLGDLKMSSRVKLLTVQERSQEVERDKLLAVNRKAEIEQDIKKIEAEKVTFVKNWQKDILETMSEIIQQINEANESINKARLRSEKVILTSPNDAVVLEIGQKSVGSVIQGAETLFVLVPVGGELKAEVEVSTTDVGEIAVGDTVRIKIDAYPFQKYGSIVGSVANISADTFSRQTALGGLSSYYRARILLDDTNLVGLPEPTMLLPGMTLSAEIITGNRSVISYFLYPVLRILDESLRER